MFSNKKSLDKQIEWARDNVPVLAAYSPDAVEKIVRRANTETESLRGWVTVGLAILSAVAAGAIHAEFRSMGASRIESYVVLSISALVGAAIGQMLGDEILRRKLQRLAGGI